MKIAIIDPFLEVSHAHWAKGISEYSSHDVTIYSNKPKHWKWQMIGGTLGIAERIKSKIENYALLIVTDMLDLPTFLGYLSKVEVPPVILYFHENQITYPWSETDDDIKENRDHHYGFMNLRSAHVADYIVFNSTYHFNSFYGALPRFIKQFPSIKWPFTIDLLKNKSSVLPIGILQKEIEKKFTYELPVFVWNHRWEYDKGPDKFFNTLFALDNEGCDFKLIVLGKPYPNQPPIFSKAKDQIQNKILHWGYVENKEEYYEKLNMANIAMVTGHQDFFGISVVEAIEYGCFPIFPNRLAYPEHLPDGKNDKALYNEGELVKKVKNVVQKKDYHKTESYQNHISKYYWGNVIQAYDLLFSQIGLIRHSPTS